MNVAGQSSEENTVDSSQNPCLQSSLATLNDEAISKALTSELSESNLIKIGETIPWCNLQELAPLLVSHPNFTDETLNKIVSNLKVQWWGDDPTECRIGWETLEREREVYLRSLEP